MRPPAATARGAGPGWGTGRGGGVGGGAGLGPGVVPAGYAPTGGTPDDTGPVPVGSISSSEGNTSPCGAGSR
ncbi:hypothetical protein DER29_5287 [Micromonospora sp. M71_S20]|nr:hypothetical protein DER29_5287 [Micromonospora sp. M71_S20]